MKAFFRKLFHYRINPLEDFETVLDRVSSWLLFVMLIVGSPLIAVAVRESINLDSPVNAIIYISLFAPLVLLAIFRHRFNYRFKAAVILICVYLFGVHDLIIYGFTGAAIPVFLTLFILVTIFFGLRPGLISIAASLVPTALVGYLLVQEVYTINFDVNQTLSTSSSWMTAWFTILVLGLLVVISYSFVKTNLFDVIRYTRKQAEDLRKSNDKLIREIHQRDKVEKSLKKAKEQAEESDRLKSAFLANMSHEFRTPLNGIMGFASLLEGDDIDQESRVQYASIIQKSGNRMLEFMNSLLDIAMIESGQTKVKAQQTSVAGIMDDVVALFKPEARKKGLKLTCCKDGPSCGQRIVTDSGKLKQVLAKLLHNAIKYTEEGDVVCGYSLNEGCLQFYVSDTGIGIDYGMQDKIFEQFRQADLNYTKEYEGAGLGLSISKAYVEMLGGRIWVDSEPGSGSTFYFSLPCQPPAHVMKEHAG